MKKTGVLWDERFVRHEMGFSHPESPKRLLVIKEVLDGGGIGKELTHVAARAATKEELMYVHDKSYIESVEATAGEEGYTYLDPDTLACAHTWEAAEYAAGGTLSLVDEVLKGDLTNGFAFVRPPGHHSEKNQAMGFCIFNNIAIAAEHAKRRHGVERIAIVDFDVHHGNGTQQAFYEREDVFFASVHRAPFYPGTGLANETGTGKGKGTTLNIPLEYGADDDVYKTVFDKQIVPAVLNFSPKLILVSAGFDSHDRDPLGGMKMTTDGYRWIATTLSHLANECCGGKVVYVLEGGYDLRALQGSVEATLEVMLSSK